MSATPGSPCYCPACNTAMAWICVCPTCSANQSEADLLWFSLHVKQRACQIADMLAEAEAKKMMSANRAMYVGQCQAVNLFNVDVLVKATRDNDSAQPPTPGATAGSAPPDTAHVNIGSADHVTVQAVTVNVDLNGTAAEIQHVTDKTIVDKVKEGVILAQVKWGSEAVQKYKEKYRQEKQRGVDSKALLEDQIRSLEAQIRLEQDAGDKELERVKKEGKKQIKKLTNQLSKALSMSERQKAASEIQRSDLIAKLAQQQKTSEDQVSKLSEELQHQKQEKEEELAALKDCYEQEKQMEQDKVINFVLMLEERDQTILRQLAVGMETEHLLRVTESLFKEHGIRLTGVDCGLRFLMEVPTSRWSHVIEQQLEIQATLNQALPTIMQSATNNWSDVTQCSKDDVDIQLGKPVNLMVVDPMRATPQRVFSFIPKTADDREEPCISSIVSTQHGTVVMADRNNNKVKMVELNSYTVTASITLNNRPWCLALLEDGLVATTTDENVIYLLRVNDKITVKSRVKTDREYSGIAGHSDGTLIVSSTKYHRVARVDVIDRRGRCLKTIVDSNTLRELCYPMYLCTVGSHVLVSDFSTNTVYRLSVTDGAVIDTLKHTDMEQPNQVCVDKADNIYIASEGGHCVLVRSGNGEWRRLLDGRQHSEGGYHMAEGVCVTSTGVLVVAWRIFNKSTVTGYELK